MPDRIHLLYAWEKTSSAVDGMAISPKPLRERIVWAYVHSLMLIQPEQNLPSELGSLFQEIQAAFRTTAASGDEGTAMASARAMDDQAVEEVARKIVQLKDHVSADYHRAAER